MNPFTKFMSPQIHAFSRSFSTAKTVLREWKTIEARRVAKVQLPEVGEKIPASLHIPKGKPEFPEYKYGESNIYKQSNKGLYGGKFIQFGNQRGEKSKVKTKRTWKLNVIKKNLWSEALNKDINIKLTTRVLRTITKEGGIDNYLTKEKSARIKELGPTGWKLRYRVLMKKLEATQDKKLYLELVKDEAGNEVPVYFKVDEKNIKFGKRKLLKTLYGLELENNTDASFKEFMAEYKDQSVEDIVHRLQKLKYDVGQLTV